MRDYVNVGSSPCEEPCVQVEPSGDYVPAMRAECKRFIDAIRAKLGAEVGSARLAIKGFPHDFGTYYEVVCYFDDADEEGMDYAYRCEDESPATWDDTKPQEKPAQGILATYAQTGNWDHIR